MKKPKPRTWTMKEISRAWNGVNWSLWPWGTTRLTTDFKAALLAQKKRKAVKK